MKRELNYCISQVKTRTAYLRVREADEAIVYNRMAYSFYSWGSSSYSSRIARLKAKDVSKHIGAASDDAKTFMQDLQKRNRGLIARRKYQECDLFYVCKVEHGLCDRLQIWTSDHVNMRIKRFFHGNLRIRHGLPNN
jgi:hypothetical protein